MHGERSEIGKLLGHLIVHPAQPLDKNAIDNIGKGEFKDTIF